MKLTADGYVCETNAEHLNNNPEMRRYFAQDMCMLSVTSALIQEMEARDVNRLELARRVGKTKGFVSQVLNGSRNMTLRTLADFAWAMGLEVRGVRFRPIGTTTLSVEAMDKWLDQWSAGSTDVGHSVTREADWDVAQEVNLALVA